VKEERRVERFGGLGYVLPEREDGFGLGGVGNRCRGERERERESVRVSCGRGFKSS